MSPLEPRCESTAASRRAFLKTTAAAALATAAAPTILNAEDKAGSKLPVLGSGAHQYEAIHGWGEHLRSILGEALNDGEKARKEATEAIELLVSKGHRGYRSLLTSEN